VSQTSGYASRHTRPFFKQGIHHLGLALGQAVIAAASVRA
jgi:hypothetical protein